MRIHELEEAEVGVSVIVIIQGLALSTMHILLTYDLDQIFFLSIVRDNTSILPHQEDFRYLFNCIKFISKKG